MTEIDVCQKLTWLSHGPIQECKKEGAQLYPQEFRMARIYFRLLFICAFIFFSKICDFELYTFRRGVRAGCAASESGHDGARMNVC